MKRFGHVQFAARTDVGKKRKNNEDALGAFPSAGIFCVADGMGGGDDGEIASAAVVKAVEDVSKLCIPPDEGGYAAADVADELENGLNKASEWIFTRTTEKRLSGCGSTFVGVVLDATHPDSALAVHAGDSRLYLLRGRSIKQITRDHSAAEMIGTKDEKKLNPIFRSMVMNAVGIRAKVEPERTPFKLAAGDRILICSDGLSRMVPDKKILSVSRQHADVGEAVDALIAAALEAGGVDNVTVLLAEITSMPEPAKALPMTESAVDFVSGDADTGSTDGTEEDTTDNMQTVQTVQPVLVQAKLDLENDFVGGHVAVQGGGARKRRIAIAVSAVLLLSVIAAGLVMRHRKETGSVTPPSASAAPVTNVVQTGGAQLIATNAVPTNAVPTDVVPTNAVSTNAVLANAVPTNAVPANVVTTDAVPTNAVPTNVVTANVVTTNAVPTNAVPANVVATKAVPTNIAPRGVQEYICTNLVVACDVAHIGIFTAKMQRLFPGGNPPYDYMDQVKQLAKNAKECSRMRSAKATEAVAVDLKIMLQTAEAAKAALAARAKTSEERRWLSEWETVLSGNPKDQSVQEACARLILSAAEVLAK